MTSKPSYRRNANCMRSLLYHRTFLTLIRLGQSYGQSAIFNTFLEIIFVNIKIKKIFYENWKRKWWCGVVFVCCSWEMRDIRSVAVMHNTRPLDYPSRIIQPHRSRSSSWSSWRRTNNVPRQEPRLSLQYQVNKNVVCSVALKSILNLISYINYVLAITSVGNRYIIQIVSGGKIE